MQGRGGACWADKTQRERRLLFVVCVLSVALFISLIFAGVFYKQSEFKARCELMESGTDTDFTFYSDGFKYSVKNNQM